MRRLLSALVIGAAFASSAFAATNPQISVSPRVRITAKVDKANLVTINGTVPGRVASLVSTGRVSPTQQLSHLQLLLTSTVEQENALHNLLAEQQDKNSPNYHQWLTPETFGQSFGVAQADIAKVAAWLGDSGLTVDSVSPGGRVITFSGPAAAVESAFSTEIHTFSVDGQTHFSNTTAISIPAALSEVVAGPARIDNFSLKASSVNPHPIVLGKDGKFYPAISGTTDQPDYTSTSSGAHYVGPQDAATIFNAAPLQAAGIDGTGVTIGVIGQSDISLSNVQTFRSLFKLAPKDPVKIYVGAPPAIIGDDIESDLDVEWAGALATNAKVLFYTAGLDGAFYDLGVDDSALDAVDTNQADIITLSYGGCEASDGAAGAAYYNTMWEQAAAQGQTVFVSTGDSSSTGCASSSATTAGRTATYGVNALGSSAYNVAVGGTGFYEGPTIAFQTGPNAFWGPGGTQPYGTALSYIPEVVWSEGAFDIITQGTGVAGGGGGVSVFTGRPVWQTGVGISSTSDPAGPTFTISGAIPASKLHRLVPDVAGIAAGGHDGTVFCSEGVCKLNPDGTAAGLGVVGGTSVATPTTASMQALINQKNGGRQGNANFYYYKLAALDAAASGGIAACAATVPTGTTITLPASTCNFHDVVTGDNYSPLTSTGKYNVATNTYSGVFGTDYIGFPATTGFDEATGLGSMNVTNIATNWAKVTFNSTTTKLTLTPTSAVHGTTMNATVTVAANSSLAPVPTGNVSIIAVGQNTIQDGDFYVLNGSGVTTAALQSLPGGTYNVYAHYAGDSVDAASDSAPISVTITKEPSELFLQPLSVATFNTFTTVPYGIGIYILTDAQGASATSVNGNDILNTGIPTGSISYTLTSNGTTLTGPTEPLDLRGSTYLDIGQGYANYLLNANYPVIVPGTWTIGASYPGDNSFGASTATTTVVVVKASSTPAVRVTSADIVSGATATFNVTVAASGAGAYPTGTITLQDTTTNTTLATGTLVNGAVPLSTNLITTLGTHTIVAQYSGDTNYNATNSLNASVTVVAGTATTVTVSASSTANPIQVLNTVTIVATLPSTVSSGAVYFYDQGTLYLGTANVGSTHTATLNIATLTAGTHNITANYTGTSTAPAGISTAFPLVVNKNTPSVSLTSGQTGTTVTTVSMNAVLTPFPAAPATTAGANPAPTLIMNFYDGTTLIGTAPIIHTANYLYYTAAFTATITTPGTHVLTAQYPGDLNYAGATSNTQTVTIYVPSFSMTATPSSLNIIRGQAGLTTLTVNSTGNYAASLAFSCSGLPQYSYCNFGSNPLTLPGTHFTETNSVVLSIVTVAPTPPVFAGLLWIPAVLFAGFLFLRRKQLSLRSRQLMMLAVMICGTLALSGCGKDVARSGVQNGTPLGAATVTVTAVATGANTSSPSGTVSVTLPINVLHE